MSRQEEAEKFERKSPLETELFNTTYRPTQNIRLINEYTPVTKADFLISKHSKDMATFEPVYVTPEQEKAVYRAMEELGNIQKEDFADRIAFQLIGRRYIENSDKREQFFLENEEEWLGYADAKTVVQAVQQKLLDEKYEKRTPKVIYVNHFDNPDKTVSRKSKIGSAIGIGSVILGGVAMAFLDGYSQNSQINQSFNQYELTQKQFQELIKKLNENGYTLPEVSAHSGDSYSLPPAILVPKLDGKFTPVKDLQFSDIGKNLSWKDQVKHEYDDALKIQLYDFETKQPVDSYLYLKVDEKYLYFMFDDIRDRTIKFGAGFDIGFDVNHNGEYKPPDIIFIGQKKAKWDLALSTPHGGTRRVSPSEQFNALMSLDKSPNSTVSHILAEGEIDRQLIDFSQKKGFYADVHDGLNSTTSAVHANRWPGNESTYADIAYSTIPIPEYANPLAIMFLSSLLTYTLLKRRKKK